MKLAMMGSFAHVGAVLKGIQGLADVRVAAACPYGPEDNLPFLGKNPATPANLPVFDDYRRMLDETRPDVVSVFVPMHRIAECARAAAERGCHVIAEKPLATELADLEALRQAAQKTGARVVAALGARATPPFQAVRNAVAAGRIGQPVLAFGQKSYPFESRGEVYARRETFGGSIPWQAIHALDFIRYCTGKDFTRVAAMHSNVTIPTHPGMEDNGGIVLELAGGGHAVILFDYLRPWTKGVARNWGDERLRIAGTRGIVELVDDGKRVELLTPSAQEDLPLPPGRNWVAEFIESLRGRGESLITPEDSFRATEVALKARQAADTGQVIEL